MSNPTTAFVLGGGGLLGAVEVGMLRALFEAGTSARPGRRHLGRRAQRRAGRRRPDDRRSSTGSSTCGQRARGQRGVRRLRVRPAAARRAHRHPPALAAGRCASGWPSELGDRHLRRPAGAVPVLRGQHRARRRALVHRRPGGRRGAGLAPPYPGCCRRREVDGEHYLDGGIVNSIPVGRAVELGADAGSSCSRSGRVDRPLEPAAAAVGGGPGVLRDRPPAPVRPRDGRAAARTSRRTCCRPAARLGARRLAAGLPRLRPRSGARIDAAYDGLAALPRGASAR